LAYDTVPYPATRVVGVPARWAITPFNITSALNDAYNRWSPWAFPQVLYTGTVRSLLRARGQANAWWLPEDLPALGSQPCRPAHRRGGPPANAGMDYLSKVPYRSIGPLTLIAP